MKKHNMTRHDEIRQSYKELGDMGNVYDGIITRSTMTGKVMDSLIWGLDRELSARWIDDALAPIPADFSGELLEVPVGTGVLTMPLYASMPEAGVTCLDYSANMMENAKKRAAAMKLSNVAFIQGDVGALPVLHPRAQNTSHRSPTRLWHYKTVLNRFVGDQYERFFAPVERT